APSTPSYAANVGGKAFSKEEQALHGTVSISLLFRRILRVDLISLPSLWFRSYFVPNVSLGCLVANVVVG
ncbi:MAG: hypothetical protein AAFY26_27045, partial [Cyanobacteria bacterium J06638_22]